MKLRKTAWLLGGLLLSMTATTAKPKPTLNDEVRAKMRAATEFMMEKVSYDGGFVWTYLPDFSRQWGEMEAKRTMVWIQPPGTPSMGHLLLDAYHATGDEYYYEQAERVAGALIWGQLECGGWNYVFDFAGENSLKDWYNTVGKSGWRLEEFQHYYGNATFDDGGTMEAAKFLLRIYVEKNDPKYRPALDKVIRFVLTSQYPIGGWPQRYPLRYDHPFHGKADYSSFLTLNDDVIPENIEFLTYCYQALGMQELKEPIYRAMYLIISMQQGAPYAGWADQYTVEDVLPAHARSYEPRAVNTGTTVRAVNLLMQYYRLTGDTRFLNGIPAAIDFLEKCALPQDMVERSDRGGYRMPGGILAPRFIDPDTGKPLFVHRSGTNAYNGRYFTNQDPANTIAHYSSFYTLYPQMLRERFEEVKQLSREELVKESPFLNTELVALPKYFMGVGGPRGEQPVTEESVRKVMQAQDDQGRWLVPLGTTSNPYKPCLDDTPSYETKYTSTYVGDEHDTSPFKCETGELCISVKAYIANMAQLIRFLDPEK
ncbi:MAG: pectate lyase [Alistipes sp.]|nr:pectate lyase [Alistipes sp.]